MQSGSATVQTFTAGAAAPGILLGVYNQGSGSCTVTLVSGVTTLVLGSAQLVIVMWNGQTWEKVGGNAFTAVLTSGTGATWKCPYTGTSGPPWSAAGAEGGRGGEQHLPGQRRGRGGGAAISTLAKTAGVILTYTVGGGGSAGTGSGGSGGAGGSSTLSDGSVTLTGGGGGGAALCSTNGYSGPGATGGVGSGGQISITGGAGGGGISIASANGSIGGKGGDSIFGGGGNASQSGASSSTSYGGGAGGQCQNNNVAGDNPGPRYQGVIVIEF